MKGNLCKILLAVSFLFLMPNLCMSQNLKGIWRLVKNAMYLEAGNRGTGSVFCPYKITRSGEYNIIAEGLYCEVLHNEYGRTASALVPISYRIDGKRMTLLFQLGNSVYREVYQKVSKLGK